MNLTPAIPKRLIVVGAVALMLAVPVVLFAQAPSKPPAPTLTPNHEERSVKVSWTSMLPPGGSVTWEVWVWTEKAGWQRLDDGSLTVTSLKHTGLESGVEYWYTYRAVYGSGTGEWSHYGNMILSDGSSGSFAAPTVTAKFDGGKIVIRWDEVPGATHYIVMCWCGFGRWDGIGEIWGTKMEHYPQPSSTYYYSVQAKDNDGNRTEWSKFAEVTTPAVIPTSTPEPYPSSTPTPTPVSSEAYAKWLPGITIAPENNCTLFSWGSYGFKSNSEEAQKLREQIVASMGGRFYDPYLGWYLAGYDEADINHVVDIGEAHSSGMCHPSRKKYAKDFVYDVENAVLTSFSLTGHSNAYDLAGWLPDLNKCWYVNQVVHVKRKYGLTMDKDEADTGIDVLSGCDSTKMIFSGSPTPTPTIVTNDPLQIYDDDKDGHISCEEARRHGIAPVHRVHPAYEYMDDPDGNGIACE